MVQRRFCPELTRRTNDTKRGRICTTERPRERIRRNILIRCSDNSTDVGVGSRVLGDRARRGGTIGEHRRIIGICHTNSDGDAICQTPIGNGDRDSVGVLCFIVEFRFCPELPTCANNTKRRRIRTTERVAQRITIHIRCSDDRSDICVGSRVLGDGARRSVLSKHRCLIDIGNTDRDSNAICQTPIGNGDHHLVGVPGFKVEGCVGLELPRRADNTKRGRIRATQRPDQRITIHIGGSDRRADVGAGCRVLRYRARRGGTIGEHRCLVNIRHIDSDSDAVTATRPIGDRNDDRIGVLRLIVKGGVGLELTICANNAKRGRIRATETISQCVAIGIGRSDNRADICVRARVLCHRTCRATAFGESRHSVIRRR